MRYRFTARGQARHWIDTESDRHLVAAVFEWVIETLCDSDKDVESVGVETPEGDAYATDLYELGIVVTWRLASQGTRIDILRVEPLP